MTSPNLYNALGFEQDDNRIINGDFGIWRRGTSHSGSGYGADRWRNDLRGGTVWPTKPRGD